MIPYFYRVCFKPTGQYYIGIQYGKDAHPTNLWDKYFTSSKVVKSLIKQYGLSSFTYKVTKTFNTAKEAMHYESRFLLRVKANKNEKFLNLSLGFKESFISRGDCTIKRRNSISKARLSTPKTKCEHCGKEVDPGNFKAWHGDKCRNNPNIDPSVLEKRKQIAKVRYDKKEIPPVEHMKKKKVCEFCQKEYSLSNYSKYHGIKCLSNPNVSAESLESRRVQNEQLAVARLSIKRFIKVL